MKVRNLSKLPKRKVTVDELLDSDSVSAMLEEIYDERHDIDELLIIHTSRKHKGLALSTNGIDESRLIAIMETIKQGVFKGDFD